MYGFSMNVLLDAADEDAEEHALASGLGPLRE
jgi:hypothetical protein